MLARYGNDLTFLDATYKTTKYALPLFFITVKTNVDHAIVGSFIVQDETTQSITEALTIIKQWNPQWKPSYFMITRTSVTRCCDLLARLKNLVHECTNLTALETLEKDLKLTLTKFESNFGEGNTNLTLSAPQKRPTQKRKRKIPEQKDVQSVSSKKRKVKKSTLPPVGPKKVHPFSKRSGQHAEMMRKCYKTTMSLQEMTETQDESSSNGQMPRKFSYANLTPTIRKGSPLTTTILRNGPHSLSHLQLKSLEPILPRGTVILLKSISKEFKTGWLYDEV